MRDLCARQLRQHGHPRSQRRPPALTNWSLLSAGAGSAFAISFFSISFGGPLRLEGFVLARDAHAHRRRDRPRLGVEHHRQAITASSTSATAPTTAGGLDVSAYRRLVVVQPPLLGGNGEKGPKTDDLIILSCRLSRSEKCGGGRRKLVHGFIRRWTENFIRGRRARPRQGSHMPARDARSELAHTRARCPCRATSRTPRWSRARIPHRRDSAPAPSRPRIVRDVDDHLRPPAAPESARATRPPPAPPHLLHRDPAVFRATVSSAHIAADALRSWGPSTRADRQARRAARRPTVRPLPGFGPVAEVLSKTACLRPRRSPTRADRSAMTAGRPARKIPRFLAADALAGRPR